MIVSLSVLSVGPSNLNVEFVSDGLELVLLVSKMRKVDVNRSSESSSEVSRAGSDVSKLVGVSKLGLVFDGSCSTGESLEHCADVSSLLHGDNSELVLLVNPNEEGLFVIVVDTSVGGPLTVEIASL